MKWFLVALACGLLASAGWLVYHLRSPETVVSPAAAGELSIVLTADGFVPKEPTIAVGTVVTFSNTTGREYWPASDLHPSHAIYADFDPRRPLQPDETWTFTFDKVGSWGLHDHIRSYYTGLIHVVE